MLNKAILCGRLTRDPEARTTNNNIAVTTFTLAVDRSYSGQDGQKETDFINIVTWRKLAETCQAYLTKGRLVAVVGRIQTRSYEGNDGQKRTVTEIVAEEVTFLESAKKNNSAPPAEQQQNAPLGGGWSPDDDDEQPF